MRAHVRICLVFAASVAACGGDDGGGEWSQAKIAACDAVLADLTMPFDYVESPDAIRVTGLDDSSLHLVFGPWGAHNSPHTGHAPGNGKADMMAVLANGAADMTSLDGTACNAYDEGAPNCGLPLDEALARRPFYILPDSFAADTLAMMEDQELGYRITDVFVKRQGTPGTENWFYFDSPDQWEIIAEICEYRFSYGHVGRLSPELQAALVDRGVSVDFDAYDGPLDQNLVEGEAVLLEPGTPVAYPQMVGSLVPAGGGQVAAYARPHRDSRILWAQIEFGTFRYEYDGSRGYAARAYDLLSPTEYANWESVLHIEMDDPNSARYGNDFGRAREWLWRSEGILAHTPEFSPESTENGLLRRLGDWWESYEGCGDNDLKCDEVISFNRIDRNSPAFDPTFYSPNSQYLIWWLRTEQTPQDGYYGEILSTDGDLLSASSGSFLVRWRNFNGGDSIDGSLGTEAYQYLAWSRGDDDSLKIAWGESSATQGDAQPAAIPTEASVCDGNSLTCYSGHNENVRPSNIDGQL